MTTITKIISTVLSRKGVLQGVLLATTILTLLLSLTLVSAFGVTSPYWDTKPLGLHPGESIDFELKLQNMVGSEDLVFKAEIVQGKEITQLMDPSPIYAVPFGRDDIIVHVRVTVPNESVVTQVRELDRIGISFTPVAGQDGRMLQLGAAVKTDIPILIGPWPPLEEPSLFSSLVSNPAVLWSTAIIAVLVLLAIIIIWRRRGQ